MLTSILLLLIGVLLAWFGGELFVKGGVRLARWARWPTAVIGVTVAAFGTSAPELMVAIHAARDGLPEISLGDVLGSNVVNVSLILGFVLALSGMKSEDPGVKSDWFVALLTPGVVGLLLADGWFSRKDAIVMMALFFGWLGLVVNRARRHSKTEIETIESVPLGLTVFILAAGLVLLIGAAQFVVHGGKGLAEALGWSPFVVGAVVVAVATSTPELATTLIARLRGHDDVGLGNILGSNIFNAFFIASVAALIQPYSVNLPEIQPSLVFGVVTTLLILPGRHGYLSRKRGFALLALYGVFVYLTLNRSGSGH